MLMGLFSQSTIFFLSNQFDELEFVFIADDDPETVDTRLFFVKFHAEGCEVHNCAVLIGVKFSFGEFPGANVKWTPLSV